MKKIYLTFLILMLFSGLYARKTIVTSATAINNGSWSAGDTIIMKNGNWTNQVISLKANGTQANPVVLQAETAGSVILNGTSKLSFSGTYITISGLYFKDGTLSGSDIISFRNSSSEVATNCTLKNSAIVNYNPADNTVDSKWVSLYGANNTVDHCSFENKNNSGTLLVVWLTSGVTVNHIISNNYFGYRNANVDATGAELNGQEIIRVGDSSTSMTTAAVTVSGNFFEKCNGEIEVVSNKSCGNLYTNNLFLECHGMLTLRHGNSCTVAGNYFFGNGVSESGGVRIIGENHKVYNNYFDNLRGTNYRAALCMVRGKENSALSEYFQVKNALVAFNTMVNCTQAFCLNYNSSTSLTLPPINSVIAHNQVYNTSSSNNNVTVDQNYVSAMSVTWKNNLMNQGKYTDFSYTGTQIITGKDPKMTVVSTPISMYEPTTGSQLANYTTAEYSEITSDIRGRNRNLSAKTPGASQLSGTVNTTMPVKSEVGAKFFNNPGTGFSDLKTTNFNWKISGKTFIISVTQPGNAFIFDVHGRCICHSTMSFPADFSTSLTDGIYFFKFINSNNETSTLKFLINN